MGKIFSGQTALRLTLKTFTDLEDCISAVIRFCKPNGVKSEFTAAVGDTANGVVFHE